MNINQPKIILDLPPGGLWTFTEVLAVLPAAVVVVAGAMLFWGASGWTVGLLGFTYLAGFTGSVSQAREKLLLPPGAWCTFTDVVPCLE